jgi:hypothetical protein
MGRIGRERGWPPPTRQRFEAERAPRGALLVGDAQEVIDKILFEHDLFGNTRFLLQMSVGTIPHDSVRDSSELLGTVVAPAARHALSLPTFHRRPASKPSSWNGDDRLQP